MLGLSRELASWGKYLNWILVSWVRHEAKASVVVGGDVR